MDASKAASLRSTDPDHLAEYSINPHEIIGKMTMGELWSLQMTPVEVSEAFWNHAATCAECSIKMHQSRIDELAVAPESEKQSAYNFANRLLDRRTAAIS